ncbi:hypothetical protein K438DRAFT_1992637 [Mycena galopus ATCC 62051]|nr:hypothetical protein K438DRAFT_1992637 [Mycena galopus ATCC 62051]
MHGSLRIGKYWKHILGFEERELCTTCQVPESLEHILLQCTRPGQAKIWSLAEELWTKKGHTWQLPTLGALLGSGLASFTVEGRKSLADDRLYKILITESTHLIWKLRCEFVVGREGTDPPSDHEVRNKWVFAMNERIEADHNLTNTLKYGKQYSVAPSLVLGTWRGVLKDENQMPDDWLREPEVLGWSQFGYLVALGTLEVQRGLDNGGFGPHPQVTAASPRLHHILPHTRGTLSTLARAHAPSVHILTTCARKHLWCPRGDTILSSPPLMCTPAHADVPQRILTVMLPRSLYSCRTDIPFTANEDRSIYQGHIAALQHSEDNTWPHGARDRDGGARTAMTPHRYTINLVLIIFISYYQPA